MYPVLMIFSSMVTLVPEDITGLLSFRLVTSMATFLVIRPTRGDCSISS